jgi:hypothetical protein
MQRANEPHTEREAPDALVGDLARELTDEQDGQGGERGCVTAAPSSAISASLNTRDRV